MLWHEPSYRQCEFPTDSHVLATHSLNWPHSSSNVCENQPPFEVDIEVDTLGVASVTVAAA